MIVLRACPFVSTIVEIIRDYLSVYIQHINVAIYNSRNYKGLFIDLVFKTKAESTIVEIIRDYLSLSSMAVSNASTIVEIIRDYLSLELFGYLKIGADLYEKLVILHSKLLDKQSLSYIIAY